MDMVFVYEDKIAQDAAGNYYTGSAFSQEIFDRYLQHFDHITILMRKANVDPNDTETLGKMNQITSEKIEVAILPNTSSSLWSFLNPKVHAKFKKAVLNELKQDRAVVIRAPSSSGAIAADYCRKNSITYLVEAVGCPWDSLWNHSFYGKLLAPWMWIGCRRTLRDADYAIYVTNTFLQHRYPSKGKSVSISDVELQQVNDSVLQKRLERIRNHSGRLKIGTAGALHVAYKGQRYVIEALAKLKETGRVDFEYHLAGGGNLSALQTLAERLGVLDQVVFEGVLRHDQMFDWLDYMDVYIQPSTVEAMPRALIEAMSRGLPVLASAVGDIPELLEENCIFPRKDAETIATKLCQLSSEQMRLMSERNFVFAKKFRRDLLEKKRGDFYSDFASQEKERLK